MSNGGKKSNKQAIFSMRGKPQNVYAKKRADLYKNEELFNMMITKVMNFGTCGLIMINTLPMACMFMWYPFRMDKQQ